MQQLQALDCFLGVQARSSQMYQKHMGVSCNVTSMSLPRAQHVNFGHSHPPNGNHPKMPSEDPQNEFPGISWIGLFFGIPILLNRKA